MTAYHESGHALLAWLVPGIDRVHEVSIIPRGRSLGVTQLLPEEDRLNISESELQTRLFFLLGGGRPRSSSSTSTAPAPRTTSTRPRSSPGDGHPLGYERAARPVAFRDSEDHPFLGREMAEPRRFSEHTAQVIDEEVCGCSRCLRQGHHDDHPEPRQARRPGQAARRDRNARRGGDRETYRRADLPPGRGGQRSRFLPLSKRNHAAMIAHNVYFTLHDNSSAAVQAMIDDCHRYLAPMPGIVFYAAGTPLDADSASSDRGYDVALHVVFQDRAAWMPT